MTRSAPGRSGAWLRRVAIGLSIGWCIALLIVFANRIGFPLELEWMEGGILQQARRIQSGASPFPPPSAEFVPFLYTPLYPIVVAVLGWAVGLDYWVARVLSIAACIATALALWRAVAREGKPAAHRWLAIGLFFSGYVFTFRWLDVGRPDAMFLALTMWGLVMLRESGGDPKKAALAGLLLASAFWTKQTAAVFVLAATVLGVLVAGRQAWTYAVVVVVSTLGGVWIGNAITEGWLWRYIYEFHQQHAFNDERFYRKTWLMFLHAAPFLSAALLVVATTTVQSWVRKHRFGAEPTQPPWRWVSDRGGVLYWGALALVGLFVSALGYATQWAEPNAFIPGWCLLSLFVAVAAPSCGRAESAVLALSSAQLLFSAALEPAFHPLQSRGWAGLGASYVMQDPSSTLVGTQQRAEARALRDELEHAPAGEVFSWHRPWWAMMSGGHGNVGSMGFADVGRDHQLELAKSVRGGLRERRYTALWFEGEPPAWMHAAMGGYRVERRLRGDERVLPVTGYMSSTGMVTPYLRDQLKFAPVEPRTVPDDARVVVDFEQPSFAGCSVDRAAFGPRPVRGVAAGMPALGGYGGEFLVSSAAGRRKLQATGELVCGPFSLALDGTVQLRVATTMPAAGRVFVELVDAKLPERIVRLDLPVGAAYMLEPIAWSVEPQWAGSEAFLRVRDQDPSAAIAVDDIWILDRASQ